MKNNDIKKNGAPYIFRYRPDNDFTLNELEENYVYFSGRESLNDPFDSNPNLINPIIKEKEKLDYFKLVLSQTKGKINKELFLKHFTPESIASESLNLISKFIDYHGIACFSMHPPINMPLMANYTNNHKGLVLQFNFQEDKDFFKRLKIVEYLEKLEEFNVNLFKKQEDLYKVFYIKDKGWEYEKELRLVKQQKGKIQFKKKALRNIICGYKSEESFIKKVLDICEKNYDETDVYILNEPKKQLKMSLTKIN